MISVKDGLLKMNKLHSDTHGETSKDSLEIRTKKLLYWKKQRLKVIRALDEKKGDIREDELKKRLIVAEKKLEESEYAMYDIEKGLYLGLGYILNENSAPKAKPIYAKWRNLNNHFGVTGATRVGKTVNMLSHIEQCIAKGWDVLVIDPKGGVNQEVLSSVAESCAKHKRASDMNYFSPAFPSLSEKINPIYGLSDIEVAAMIVASIATPNMESFYLEVSERILMAITSSFGYLQEVSDPTGKITRYLEEQEIVKYQEYTNKTQLNETDTYTELNTFSDMVNNFHIDQEEENVLEQFKSNGFNRTLITFKELEYYCHYESLSSLRSLVDSMPINEDQIYTKDIHLLKEESLSLLNSSLSTEEAHFSKISDTLSNRLIQLSIGPIGDLMCSNRINPLMNRILRKDKGVVSVIQPFPMKFKRSAEVFNKMLLGMLGSMFGTVGAEGKGLPRRVAIFIDEAGKVAFPGIEDFFNRVGGLGGTCFVYTQADEDYEDAVGVILKKVILANINTVAYMRQKSLETSTIAAETIGTYEQMKTIAMVSSRSDGGKFTTDVDTKYLCKPSSIQSFPVGEGVLIHEGEKYYMEFPFRLPPKGVIRMPELDTEIAKRNLVDFEMKIENFIRRDLNDQ